MADDTPSAPKHPQDGPSELRGLDPGELLARGLHTVKPSVGANPWEPPTPEEVARLLPQYRVEKLIGRGGMGAVYKGIQLNLDRAVAIKLLPVEVAANKEFVTRFEREARTLAKLQHSRIVTIFDFGRTVEGHLYFVMEYIDGTDLRSILRGPGLDPEQALMLVGQLCDALQAAHREGIVHRDIKPENVLITRDGYVKLADFGLARPPQQEGTPDLTQTNLVLGTPDYMAPEQRFGAAKANERSDIFALGVMLYEMLTGQTPRGVFDPPSRRVQMDVRIDEVVLKALQSEPERRYQKASELKTAVENIRTTPLPVPASIPPKPKRTRVPVYAAVASALLLLAVGGTVGYMHWPRPARAPAAEAAEKVAQPASNRQRVDSDGRIPATAAAPAVTPTAAGPSTPPPAAPTAEITPAAAVNPPAASPAARRGLQVYEAMVGYNWAWMNVGQDTTPLVVSFNWDGHVSGGWTWKPVYKTDGETVVECIWGDNGHQYLKLNEAGDAFDAFDPEGRLTVRGKRLSPVGQPVGQEELAALVRSTQATPTPVSPAARRAAQIYEAIISYHWAWINIGDTKPPMVVDFTWDGHVSGGWTWEMIYKPDGETLVHCNWNGNGHQYLRMNAACDAFDAFDNDGKFKVQGKRLGPVDQPVNVAAVRAPQSVPPQPNSKPSKQIEPLLEPCLNAILAPLEANPQMPRVPVEKLRASLGGDAVKVKTPQEKQIYQYGIAVCEALTNGMDERALTKAAALSSAQVPWLSNGSSIVNTMPLRGRDAGRAGNAIRQKQNDQRNYADAQGIANSSFMESSAYKAWIAKSAMLRQNVMGLYTKLVQLEAVEPAK